MRKSIVVCLWLVLAGCGGDDGSDGGIGPAGIPGSAQERTFTRNDGSVTSLPNTSGGYTATQTVTISNDDAGAGAAVVNLLNAVGDITSSASASGYSIQVILRADAPSDAHCRRP